MVGCGHVAAGLRRPRRALSALRSLGDCVVGGAARAGGSQHRLARRAPTTAKRAAAEKTGEAGLSSWRASLTLPKYVAASARPTAVDAAARSAITTRRYLCLSRAAPLRAAASRRDRRVADMPEVPVSGTQGWHDQY